MFSGKWIKYGLMLFSLFFFLTYVLELDAYARAGGGRSFGSRGSRSYSAPKAPSAAPAAPSRVAPAPAAPMAQPQSGGFLRNMAGGLMGGLIGGMIGGMLFRSLGFAGPGMGGGIGLFDIILIGLILYGIWWFIKKRRREALEPVGPGYYRESSAPGPQQPAYTPSYGQPASSEADVETGLGYVRQMDPAFDELRFKEQCMDIFFQVQGAWSNRDMSAARNVLTDELQRIIQDDADELKRNGRINRLDNIAVRSSEITEVWQEGGNDFITVRFLANVLDYTVDEKTGQVTAGSKTTPVKFEEFWTFTRPVGNNPWQLSAINQVA
jgi:predicted lipid-binding transport protein (Tim44 family)